MSGAETKGRATERATWLPFRAAVRPSLPTAAAMMMLGVMLMERVMRRRTQGAAVHRRAPSETICPAMVQTMPAEIPERRRARAKIVPAAGAMVEARREWMAKREASAVEEGREEPARIRSAELTKRAKVKREMASSVIE